jgi:hypothetical protein
MMCSIFADDGVDFVPVFYWIGYIVHDHIRVLTCRMDMDMTISENCLEDSCDLGIDLLYSIQSTLCDTTRE